MSKRLVVYIRVSKTFNLLCDIVGHPHRIEVERCGRHGVCLAEQDRKEEDAMLCVKIIRLYAIASPFVSEHHLIGAA